ncbi:hypothetical protein E4U41_001165 [Claviceps citrina]|nr:hypothetical protein E4U41_001165 [Claviceps citrina]
MAQRSTTSSPIGNLQVSLKQTSSSPLVVQAAVMNKNSYPVTVVCYDSPLDSLALKRGLVSITPENSGSPLDLPVIQVRRMWPPPADALIPIAPGGSVVNNITIGGPGFDDNLLKSVSRATVTMAGKWLAVWAKEKDSIENIDVAGADPDPEVYSGRFASDSLIVTFD